MNGSELYVSISEIESLIEEAKSGHQHKANQAILKDDLKQGWAALASMEALDSFLYLCRVRAGQFAPEVRQSRSDAFAALKRAPLQLVGKRLRKKEGA